MNKPIVNLTIKPENVKAHADIEDEMIRHKNEYYHFEVRYSGGSIVDFVVREYVTYEKFKQ